MEIRRTSLEGCSTATGTVVAIDVLRAFSTAAYAFAAGANRIILTDSPEEAFALREQNPDALLMGEVGGLPVEGFDFGNSPTSLIGQNLAGKQLIQRTSAGTQGVVRSVNADTLLATSFCCARATASYIRNISPSKLTFVITGWFSDGQGDEDAACADYIEALLNGEDPDTAPFTRRVRESPAGDKFTDPTRPEFPASDLEYCLEVDRFNFAMPVKRQNQHMVLYAVPQPE